MSLMEKKMPLPSFSETFNMPSKILARFKDNPNYDNDDLSNSDIFPNNCSCCWATESFNSRVPSPIWNDTNFKIVSELTGLNSRIPEISYKSNTLECQLHEEFEETDIETIGSGKTVGSILKIVSELTGITSRTSEISYKSNPLECQQCEEFEETDIETIGNGKTVGSIFKIMSEQTGLTSRIPEISLSNAPKCQQHEAFEEVGIETTESVKTVGSFEIKCLTNTKKDSPSKCFKQVNLTDMRDCSMSAKACSIVKNESFCEHHSESSKNSLNSDGVPLQLFGEREKVEFAAEVSNSGNSGDQCPILGNLSESGDEMVDSNELERNPSDENAPAAGVSKNIVSSLQENCSREISDIGNLNNSSNQESKKANFSCLESVKNNNEQLSKIKIKKERKLVEKQVAGNRDEQLANIINQFPCDKCLKTYKSKKTLNWHRRKNPDCKPPLSTIMKNKSCTKDSVASVNLEKIKIENILQTNVTDLVTNKNVASHRKKLKKSLTSVVQRIEEPIEDYENSVGSQFCSGMNKTMDTGSKNSCKEFKRNANSGDTGSKNLIWQCELCVKSYKHKSSLHKHKKNSHPLEFGKVVEFEK